jgi:Spx/MgsR family transcriptional regulator
MMTLRIYGLKKCSTCQKALGWLDNTSVRYEFTDVKEAPLDASRVAKWSKALGGWEKMVNRAGYTWRGLSAAETANLTEAKAVALTVKNPSLIRRPLVEYGDGSVSVGFSEKTRALFKP